MHVSYSLHLCVICMYIGPPVINFLINSTISCEGRKVNLICNATNDVDAINPLSINWYDSKGKKFGSDDKHVLVYNTSNPVTGQVQSVLLFDPVNHTDSGEYTCHAFNDDDCYTEDKTNLTVECEILLIIYILKSLMLYLLLDAPAISISPPSPHRIKVGDFLLLLCNAEGLPRPTVQWYKDKNAIGVISDKIYYVPTTSPHTTVYTCFSRNNACGKIHTVEAKITVIVQCKYMFVNIIVLFLCLLFLISSTSCTMYGHNTSS